VDSEVCDAGSPSEYSRMIRCENGFVFSLQAGDAYFHDLLVFDANGHSDVTGRSQGCRISGAPFANPQTTRSRLPVKQILCECSDPLLPRHAWWAIPARGGTTAHLK
jgi:hypothetical protein